MSVQTVRGTIPSAQLGRTLTHEHFSLNFEKFYVAPPPELARFFTDQSISLETSGFIRQYPYSSRFNINFADSAAHKAVRRDVELFKEFGGGAIAENSCYGLDCPLELMHDISSTSGVHVVAGTGFYVSLVQSEVTQARSVESLHETIVKDVREGHEVSTKSQGVQRIKYGFIGEVGSGWPLTEFEKRVIRATAEAQQQLKCGVSFHPGRDVEAPFEIVRLYLEAGGAADKCVMSHLDRTLIHIREKLFELAELGIFCQQDLFGTECSHYQLNPNFDMPSDAQRIAAAVALIEDGRAGQVLLSHDIHTKLRLTSYGGHGFSHILTNVLPKMKQKGVSDELIDLITIGNPARWLEIKE